MFARWAGGETRHTHAWQPMEIAMVPWPLCRQRKARLFYRGLPAACRLYVRHRPAQCHSDPCLQTLTLSPYCVRRRAWAANPGMGTCKAAWSAPRSVSALSAHKHEKITGGFGLGFLRCRGPSAGPVLFSVFLLSATLPHNGQSRLCRSAHLEKTSKHINSSCADYRGCLG